MAWYDGWKAAGERVWCEAIGEKPRETERTRHDASGNNCRHLMSALHGGPDPWKKPGSGLAAHYFITLVHCGEAFTFVPSFTGGSILMFGP